MESLKKVGIAGLEWLVRLLKFSFEMWVVPIDWRKACIVTTSVPLQREG